MPYWYDLPAIFQLERVIDSLTNRLEDEDPEIV